MTKKTYKPKPKVEPEKVEVTPQPQKPDFQIQFEAEQAALIAAAKAFDIDDFTPGANDTYNVFVSGIGADGKGRMIHYKRLNAGDGKVLEPYARDSRFNQGLRTLALMMFKADGKTTFEKLQKIPIQDAAAIVQATLGAPKTFQPTSSGDVVQAER